jgi:preprotein translocase subunit YajC
LDVENSIIFKEAIVMNSFMFSLLMGSPDAAAGGAPGSFVSTLIPFALIIAIFYFLIIRPQNKKNRKRPSVC